MAEIKLTGQMKVKTLKANFKEAFGGTLRVYKSTSCKGGFADDDATLAAIRAEGAKGGELNIVGQMQVGNFEKKIAEMYGIGVQVANADDTKLVDNSLTLGAVSRMANGEEASQLRRNVVKASKGENADPQEAETMSLIEKLRTDFIVETEDRVYYWTGNDYSDPDLFIENIKAQMTDSQLEILEVLKYTDPDSLVNYLNEDPDELQLAIAIVNAAYCNLKQIDFADADVYIDYEVYYFNDEKTGFGYEIETDIDLQ